jgi:hypothetical protein
LLVVASGHVEAPHSVSVGVHPLPLCLRAIKASAIFAG